MTFTEFVAASGLSISHLKSNVWGRARIGNERQENASYFYGGDFGFVMNWKDGSDKVSVWQHDREMTQPDREAMARRITASQNAYKLQRDDGRREAAKKAQLILSGCKLELHPYLASKGFPAAVGNIYFENFNPVLVIPMSYKGNICGVQTINVGGDKKFLYGQRTSMAHHTIGSTGRTYLVEGYASALSLRALLCALSISQHTIVVTFSANNLGKLAPNYPGALVIADNDESGTGQRVAEATGLQWWMPDVVGQDINDMHKALGLFKSSQLLRKVVSNSMF